MKSLSFLITSILVSLSYYTLSAQPVEEPPRDAAYDKVTVEEREILQYDHIREADVFYSMRVWRVIDTREKMNQKFRYPKQYLVNILRDHAIEGSITVYDQLDDEFQTPIPPTEVASLGVGTSDTIRVIDPFTFEEKVEITNPEFDPQKIKKFRIKEDWIFDEETSTMVVRILGIAPIIEVIDENGNYRGDQVLFWCYYPELRPVLAQYRVFNPHNDATTVSWEDLFEMRFFSSYIIKESNVQDRRIQDYATGLEALLESDRVKYDIFNYEHDLWSY